MKLSTWFVALQLLIFSYSADAAIVHFTAKNLTNNTVVYPDSIRIVNVTKNTSYLMVKNNNFDVDAFMPVNVVLNNEQPSLYIKIYNGAISFFSNSQQEISYSLNDLSGREFIRNKVNLASGENNIEFKSNAIANGFYELNVSSQFGLKTVKFLKINEDIFQNKNFEISSVLPCQTKTMKILASSDQFTFYGYWRRSIDSVVKIKCENDTTLNFNFYDSFYFSNVILEITGINVLKIHINYRWNGPPPNQGITKCDTSKATISLSYNLYDSRIPYLESELMFHYSCPSCYNKNSHSNEVILCREDLKQFTDKPNNHHTCLNEITTFTLDTINKYIPNFSSNFFYLDHADSWQDPGFNVTDDRRLNLKDLPIGINEFGVIMCYVYGKKINDVFLIDKYYSSNTSAGISQNGTPQISDTYTIKIIDFTPDAYLKLTLYP